MTTKKIICSSCDKKLKKDEVYYAEEDTPSAGEAFCEDCYYGDEEPCATVYYNGDKGDPKQITHTHNDTEGDFRVKWHSTDAWRGYYSIESDTFINVNSDAILSMHESEKMLKNFDDLMQEKLQAQNIDYARVFSRTSNLFSSGYDFFVEKGRALEALLIIAQVKIQVDYNNPLYSTGIIFGRDELAKFKELFPEKDIKVDNDIFELAKNEDLVQELADRLHKVHE